MAYSYKNIVITPNIGSSSIDPTIQFSGGSSTTNTDVYLRVYPENSGTLSFEGSSGQLFSITNDMTGSIFSVNDISGIPSIDVNASGTILLAPYSGYVGIGTTSPQTEFSINSSTNTTASSYGSYTFGLVNRGFGDFTIGSDGSYVYMQTWQSKPFIINSQGNNVLFTGNTNVGIGTNNPSNKLTVNANNAIVATGIYGFRQATSASDYSALSFTNPAQSTQYASVGFDINSSLIFTTGGSVGLGTERMRIDSSGLVGIGTNSAIRKLHVSQTTACEQIIEQVDALANSKKWNFLVDGGNGSTAANFSIRLINDAGNATTLSGFVINGTTGIISDFKGGIRSAPINNQTTGYQLVLADVGKVISITTGGITVPASVFSAGDMITIYNNSGSSQTITTTAVTSYLAGTATTGNRTLAQRGVATILCVAANTFVMSGAGLS